MDTGCLVAGSLAIAQLFSTEGRLIWELRIDGNGNTPCEGSGSFYRISNGAIGNFINTVNFFFSNYFYLISKKTNI